MNKNMNRNLVWRLNNVKWSIVIYTILYLLLTNFNYAVTGKREKDSNDINIISNNLPYKTGTFEHTFYDDNESKYVRGPKISNNKINAEYIQMSNVSSELETVKNIWYEYVNIKDPKPVDVTRFIFNDLLLSSVYKLGAHEGDQKLFVDRPTKVSLGEYNYNFFKLFEKVKNDSENRLFNADLKKFLDENFADIRNSLEIVEVKDDKNIKKLVDIKWKDCEICVKNNYENIYVKLKETWNDLIRKVNTKCTNTGVNNTCVTTQLDTDDISFAVPGGRFKELYYWDSYFVEMGLLLSGRENVALNILKLFKKWINEHGHVPNGGRTYYLNRSQPPMFAMMVNLYLKHITNDANYAAVDVDEVMSSNALGNANHKKIITIISEYGNTLIKERTGFWDKDRYSFVPKCVDKLRGELNALFTGENSSILDMNSPYKKLNNLTNIYDKNNLDDDFIQLSCSGYHYGPDLHLIQDVDNNFNTQENLSDEDYENWLKKLFKNFMPRIESFGHDIEIANLFTDTDVGKENLANNVKNPELKKKIIMQTLASYAESGWDFSSRWVSSPILEHDGKLAFMKIASSIDYIPSDKKEYDKLKFNSKILLSNLESAKIFPIDLNSILLENSRIISLFLNYFNINVCKNNYYYKKDKIVFSHFKKLIYQDYSSKKEKVRSLAGNAELICEDIDNKITLFDLKYKGLRNFIALMLWDPENNHFGDYNEHHSQVNQEPSGAMSFSYLLDTGDIQRRINNIKSVAYNAQQRINEGYKLSEKLDPIRIENVIFNTDYIKKALPCVDNQKLSLIYSDAHLELAQIYKNLSNKNAGEKVTSRLGLFDDEMVYKEYLKNVDSVYKNTQKDIYELTSNSGCLATSKNNLYDDENWVVSKDPTFDNVITLNELIKISGIVYPDYYTSVSYIKPDEKTTKYIPKHLFYDLYSSRISFSNEISSFLNLVYSLTTYNDNIDLKTRISLPVSATSMQTDLQWDFPNNWAPFEYATTFSIIPIIKYKTLSLYTCSLFSDLYNQKYEDIPYSFSLILHQHKGFTHTKTKQYPYVLLQSLQSCDKNIKSILDIFTFSTFIDRLSNYINLIIGNSKVSPDTDGDRAKFFEKYNVVFQTSGTGGEYAAQTGFGWTNGYLQLSLYNVAQYYSQIDNK